MNRIRILPDPQALARAAAEHFVASASRVIAKRDRFSVALSGGSTPRQTYALLATEEFSARVDWSRTHVFWGDERCVPPDDPRSNYAMAHQVMLEHVPLPAENIHRIRGETAPHVAAEEYETSLRAFFARPPVGQSTNFAQSLPTFDLILLGMGADGHTASLFPGTPLLHEKWRWAGTTYVESAHQARVTLTPPPINAALQVTFIVSGAPKALTLRRALAGPYRPDVLPVQIVRPANGRLLWLVDAEAGALLSKQRG